MLWITMNSSEISMWVTWLHVWVTWHDYHLFQHVCVINEAGKERYAWCYKDVSPFSKTYYSQLIFGIYTDASNKGHSAMKVKPPYKGQSLLCIQNNLRKRTTSLQRTISSMYTYSIQNNLRKRTISSMYTYSIQNDLRKRTTSLQRTI